MIFLKGIFDKLFMYIDIRLVCKVHLGQVWARGRVFQALKNQQIIHMF